MSISVFWPSTCAWGSWRSTEWTTSRRAPSATTESLCTGKKGKIGHGICKRNGNASCEKSPETWTRFYSSLILHKLMAKSKVDFPASAVEVKFPLPLWFLSMANISSTKMHATLLHSCLKGATCWLLFCFNLTGPSLWYLWPLLIEIDVVKMSISLWINLMYAIFPLILEINHECEKYFTILQILQII